jgi:putative flippase GtrA
MVSSSNLPGPGTLSDPSEPLAREHGRSSARQASWDRSGAPDAETGGAGRAPEPNVAAGGPETVQANAAEGVGDPRPLDTGGAERVTSTLDGEPRETAEGEEPPARLAPKSPVHWVIGAHWLGRWRTPLAVRLWRYGAGSIVAFATSTVVLFICLSWAELGAIESTVIAFLAGAIPNWVLNRRWAWEKRGREGMVKETTLYVTVSLVALAASSALDKFTAVEAGHLHSELAKDFLVTVAYMFSVVVLTGLKYVAYDRLVFVDRPSSRDQVLSTTEQNR